jgi:hypothetical protein
MAGEAEAALGGGGSRRRWRSPASVRKEEEEAGSAEWAERPNMPVGWLGRVGRNLKRISFRNFFWIFKYIKALQICTRRFRRNFDVEIFHKFL